MNLNLFNRNGSDASNSSWYTLDGSMQLGDTEAASALQKYQHLDPTELAEAEAAGSLSSSASLSAARTWMNRTRLHGQHNVTESEKTRLQSRAERAGTRQEAV